MQMWLRLAAWAISGSNLQTNTSLEEGWLEYRSHRITRNTSTGLPKLQITLFIFPEWTHKRQSVSLGKGKSLIGMGQINGIKYINILAKPSPPPLAFHACSSISPNWIIAKRKSKSAPFYAAQTLLTIEQSRDRGVKIHFMDRRRVCIFILLYQIQKLLICSIKMALLWNTSVQQNSWLTVADRFSTFSKRPCRKGWTAFLKQIFEKVNWSFLKKKTLEREVNSYL